MTYCLIGSVGVDPPWELGAESRLWCSCPEDGFMGLDNITRCSAILFERRYFLGDKSKWSLPDMAEHGWAKFQPTK
jgi:hypothetical protein